VSSALRILGTGSRDWRDRDIIRGALLDVLGEFTTIGAPVLIVGGQVSRDKQTGERYGADHLLEAVWTEIAQERPGWLTKPEVHPARWHDPCRPECEPDHRRPGRNGGASTCPAQGNYRNQHMVDLGARICLAFPLPSSRGTYDCMARAEAAGIPVKTYEHVERP
jgi:hypothetical protein